MPKTGSMMMEFILKALAENKYENLEWVEINYKFKLTCMNRRNKNWTSRKYSQLFQDWDKMKQRDVSHKVDTMRARFISGLKKSKYFRYLAGDSKKNCKSNEICRVYAILPNGKDILPLADVDDVENIQPENNSSLFPDLNNFVAEQSNAVINGGQPLGDISSYSKMLDLACSSQDIKDSLEDFMQYCEDSNPRIDELENLLNANNIPGDINYVDNGNMYSDLNVKQDYEKLDFPMEEPIMQTVIQNEVSPLQPVVSSWLTDFTLFQETKEETVSPPASVSPEFPIEGPIMQSVFENEISPLQPVVSSCSTDFTSFQETREETVCSPANVNQDCITPPYQQLTLVENVLCVGITTVGEQKYQVLLKPMVE